MGQLRRTRRDLMASLPILAEIGLARTTIGRRLAELIPNADQTLGKLFRGRSNSAMRRPHARQFSANACTTTPCLAISRVCGAVLESPAPPPAPTEGCKFQRSGSRAHGPFLGTRFGGQLHGVLLGKCRSVGKWREKRRRRFAPSWAHLNPMMATNPMHGGHHMSHGAVTAPSQSARHPLNPCLRGIWRRRRQQFKTHDGGGANLHPNPKAARTFRTEIPSGPRFAGRPQMWMPPRRYGTEWGRIGTWRYGTRRPRRPDDMCCVSVHAMCHTPGGRTTRTRL